MRNVFSRRDFLKASAAAVLAASAAGVLTGCDGGGSEIPSATIGLGEFEVTMTADMGRDSKEDFGQNKKYREKFDVATSRAVANLSTLSEYLIPLVKVGGKCICMKAANATEEIDQAKKAISVLCGAIFKVDEFCLPQSDIGRTIIEIKKEKQTPNKYPRKSGIPSKEPIK